MIITLWGSLVLSDSNSNLLTDNNSIPKEFIRRQGSQLIVGTDDRPIFLRGVAFSNLFWTGSLPTSHNNEIDFQRVHNMHMNVVRLYLNYKYFEDFPYRYKQSGWDWLDRNIQWAKNHNVYLILDMQVPQGGYQPNGQGKALWRVPQNQRRLAALWSAIAERYRDEPIIAGYDLVNEPVPPSLERWRNLAAELAETIRRIDKNHLLIVTRAEWVAGDWAHTYFEPGFFPINDSNVMYSFHFYHPLKYTHQNTPWTRFPNGGSYPDRKVTGPSNGNWVAGLMTNPMAPAGDSPWTFYQGDIFQVTDPEIILAKAVLVTQGTGKTGVVYFRELVVKEYDENKTFIRDIYTSGISSARDWRYWSKNYSGKFEFSNGRSGDKEIKISGTTGDALCSDNNNRFIVIPGHYYQICGWLKGENLSPDAVCQFRIDFQTNQPGGRIYSRNKDYLEWLLNRFAVFGKQNNVPLFCGEFGVYHDCLENGKGGLNWLADMIDLMKARGLHFTYHSYHEPDFGIYRNTDGSPDPAYANEKLIELFTKKLE